MADEVYFNEPGFENEAGAAEGEKKNEEMQILWDLLMLNLLF